MDGRTERDHSIASALARPAADQDRLVIRQAVRHLASTGREFTADDVRELLPAVNGSLIGAAFLAAASSKLIVRVGDRTVRHDAGHARRVGVWQGRSGESDASRPPARPEEPTPARPASTGPEPVWQKARRLLSEGRVRVRVADLEGRITVHVQADSGERYVVHRGVGGRWSCSCEAGRYGGACSHREAVKLIAAGETV